MTTVDRAAEFAARREQWHQKYLKPAAERPQSTARGVHHVALICSDVEQTIQFYIAISTDPENLERIKRRLEAKGIQYLGPDRGVTTSIYFKDPDGIQIELIAEPLRIMDGRSLG